jgi:hypothetical protein
MRTVLIEYTLNDDADVATLERHIDEFVSGIRELDAGIRYVSHRKRDTARSYVHVGFIPSEEAGQRLQAAPFFKPFAEFLRATCKEGPRTTWLEIVASSDR